MTSNSSIKRLLAVALSAGASPPAAGTPLLSGLLQVTVQAMGP